MKAGVPILGVGPVLSGPAGIVAGALKLLLVYLQERPHIVHFFLPHAYVIGGLGRTASRTQVAYHEPA